MVIFIRDNECFEPRVKNYIHYFETNGIAYHVLAWNRNGTATEQPHFTFFQRRAEYGKRIANIPNKLLWMLFVIRMIFKKRKECDVIHACDIDAVLPALLAGKLLRKKVIFDIFDWISSLTGKGIAYRIVERLQNFSYKHSDYVILCEEERKAQAKAENDAVFVLPNIPNSNIEFDAATVSKIEKQRQSFKTVISYVGVFDRDRGLENLLTCVAALPHVLLNIAGFGVLDDLIQDYAERYENICYWGRVDYSVGQSIMKCSDLISAMYYLSSPLHKFAAPNKYYESLVLGVPIITTENTLVGCKAAKFDTGFVIDETEDALKQLLTDCELKQKIEKKAANCRNAWSKVYSRYYNEFMENNYKKMIHFDRQNI